MLTAKEAVSRVRDGAKHAAHDGVRSPNLSVGDHVRQGDLYIWALEEIPSGAVPMGAVHLQLAPGTSQGSRHALDSADGVSMFSLRTPNALQGPMFMLDQPRTITHPEHGHITLPPGCYGVTYQRAYADELRAVRD